MASGKAVWALIEQKGNYLEDACLPVLVEASKLATQMQAESCAILAGKPAPNVLDRLGAHGVNRLYTVESGELQTSMLDYYAEVIARLVQREEPDILLCPPTILMRDLAPRLSVKLQTGLVSGCVGLEFDDNELLLQTKPIFGGKATGTYVCSSTKPQMATISSDIVTGRPNATVVKTEVISYQPDLKPDGGNIRGLDYLTDDVRSLGLEEADIVVAGGRGMGNTENFSMLWRLAELLGGTVAGSRMALDDGWIPRDRLVGQTGKTISPKLYIACAISGASQHVIAIRDSSLIVAINKDPNAPILKLADIAIVADVLEVLPAVINELESSIETG